MSWLAVLGGYVFAVIGGDALVLPVVDALWWGLGWEGPGDEALRGKGWLTQLVGLVERAVYMTCLLLGFASFIGLWVLLKGIGQWESWKGERKVGERTLRGKEVFQIFLVGNALSVAFGAAGVELAVLLDGEEWIAAAAMAVVVCLASYALQHWIHRRLLQSEASTAETAPAKPEE